MPTKLRNACSIITILALSAIAAAEEPSFEIAAAHALHKIRRDGADLGKLTFAPRINLQAARDESESFQLVVIPNQQNLTAVRVQVTPLTGPGAPLTLTAHRVEYVRTGNPSYQVEHVGWWPDPLLPLTPFDLPADRVQPLWFTVTVPAAAVPGVYRGNVAIQTAAHTETIPVTLRVRNFTLPRPGTLAMPFGLYKSKIEQWYLQKGQTMPIDIFARWCEFLAQYRLTPKNIGYEYVQREYVKDETGAKTLHLDLSQLKRTVGPLAEKYFAPYSYGLYRLASGPSVEKALKENKSWVTADAMAATVKTYFDAWHDMGFPEQAYVYGVDEPRGDEMIELLHKTYSKIRELTPSCKIMQTGLCDRPELIGLVDIWCPKNEIAWKPFFQDRLADGDILWQYVCVSPIPPHANFFIDEPALDHRILFWQTKKINATGLLYWAVIWWQGLTPTAASGQPCFPDVPLDIRQQSLYTDTWVSVNGDGILLYPGPDFTPLPSIRLEVIRDGVEDYEYLALLDTLIEQVAEIPPYQTPKGKTVIAQARALAAVPDNITSASDVFTQEPRLIFQRRRAVADMIEQLTDILTNQDYARWK